MRFAMLVKASAESEAGVLPSAELLQAMGRYNEEMVNAGVDMTGLVSRGSVRRRWSWTTWARGSIDGESC